MKLSNVWLVVTLLCLLGAGQVWAKSVTLSWDPSPSTVSGYRIYYHTVEVELGNAGTVEVDAGDVLTYTINNLPDASDHYFAVAAYDTSENESVFSNVVHSPPVDTGGGTTNNDPVLAPIGAKSVAESTSLTFTVSANDADGDSLDYSATNLPAGATFTASSRTFSWVPGSVQVGTYDVTFTVSDGAASDSEVVTITVIGGNQAPVLTPIGSKTVDENSILSFSVSANDADGDSLTFSTGALPDGVVFNPLTRTFSWTPDYSQSGFYSVNFNVSDGSLSDSETVAITVNDVNRAPLLAEIGIQTVNEGTSLSFTISGFDPDDDGLTYSATDVPAGANFNPVTRQFSWTPPFETTENTRIYPVVFTVTDGVLSDSETVTINVVNVNRAPVLEPIGTQNLTEGDSFNLVINADDADGNLLTYSASNVPSGAVFTPSTRSLSWIPTVDQSGSYAVTFTVSDGVLTDSEVVTLNVGDLNQAPVLDAIGNQTVNEGVELVLTITGSDPENDPLTFGAASLPAGASFDAVQGRFSWTPDFTQAGNYTVTFTVTDGAFSDSETVSIAVANSNQSPTISGSPATTVMATSNYSFTPTAADPDGGNLTFSISNQPTWADFDSATGRLSGTPAESQAGTTAAIAIGASDGNSIVFLPLFSIEVLPYVPVDSDGDGVYDNQDAFPNDPNEWLDTDGDLIGNNADIDDDNDGVADIRDGAPLDNSQSGWLITASAGSGGFITPEGETSVLYGGSQVYNLTPMAGYYISDLLIDNVSVGVLASYQFDNIRTHHTIQAVFTPIPTGLSIDPTTDGLPGVARVDGGDDTNNLVSSTPKLDLDFRFHVTLRDAVVADQRKVYLVLDGYRYRMQLTDGALSNGAEYTYEIQLGPGYAHQFYFIAEDNFDNQLSRYPATGELIGPTVELLNGKNLVGISAAIDSSALNSIDLLNDSQVFRWAATDFTLVNDGGPMVAGQGYLLKRTASSTLPQLDIYGEIATATHEIAVTPGWNLISNPYQGTVALADLQVVVGSSAPVDWLTAVANSLVVDAAYSYLGEDWGDTNAFASAAGDDSAALTPWIGYWIYVNPNAQPVKLLFTRPQQ